MKDTIVLSGRSANIGYMKSKHKISKQLYTNLNFDLIAGEMTCLLGVNGAGKSTLLRTISGTQPILAGDILLRGKNIFKYDTKELAQLIALVLTDKTSVGGFTVRELVELGRYPHIGFFGRLDTKDKDIAQKAMEDVGILYKADSYVSELSDGEKQKVMIAKSLAQECPVLILDEPTAFLDIESRIEIMNLLHNLAITQNKAVLLSTHDLNIALLLADKLWLLSKDFGLKSGVTEDIVISDEMDTFFKNKNTIFDKKTGIHLPKRDYQTKAFVSENSDYTYWLKNILARYNVEIVTDKTDAEFDIRMEATDKIVIQPKGDSELQFSNFAKLAQYLKIKKD